MKKGVMEHFLRSGRNQGKVRENDSRKKWPFCKNDNSEFFYMTLWSHFEKVTYKVAKSKYF